MRTPSFLDFLPFIYHSQINLSLRIIQVMIGLSQVPRPVLNYHPIKKMSSTTPVIPVTRISDVLKGGGRLY